MNQKDKWRTGLYAANTEQARRLVEEIDDLHWQRAWALAGANLIGADINDTVREMVKSLGGTLDVDSKEKE